MLPCPSPDRQTFLLLFDVRLIPDPKSVFPKIPGTDPQVSDFVLTSTEALQLLPGYWSAITGCLSLLEKSERYTALHINVMCGGGFQRSVAVVEHFAGKLRELGHQVTVEHLRLAEEIAAGRLPQPPA